MKLGEPLPYRVKKIAELQATPPSNSWPFEFRGRVENYPVYRIPLDFPKYRLNNGRTLAAQEEWLASHPALDRDLFARDQELETAQEEQHQILDGMVDDEKLLQYFRENGQKEPLILSHMGFVINGNRRLCAFRKLYSEDSTKYRQFAHLDVIILPPATDKEVYELEVELQIKPDIQSKYSWLREAKMMRRGRELYKYSDDDLARIHGCKPRDVKEKIQLLEYADAYLAERGKDKQYHLVEKSEFAFRKLKEGKERFKKEGDRLVFEKLAYILLDSPEGKGRLYQAIPDVEENYAKIVNRIQTEVPVSSPTSKPSGEVELLGGGDDSSVELAKAVMDPGNREKILDAMVDVVQGEKLKARDIKTATYAVKRVQAANTALNEALNTLNENSVLDGFQNQLDAVESAVGKLRKWLKDHA
jgi:hypothetical protein